MRLKKEKYTVKSLCLIMIVFLFILPIQLFSKYKGDVFFSAATLETEVIKGDCDILDSEYRSPFETYSGLGLDIEILLFQKWKENWKWGYGIYAFRFLTGTHNNMLEFPEFIGGSIGISYKVNTHTLIMLKQSFGAGVFALLGAVVWGSSRSSISLFPVYPWPVEIFGQFSYIGMYASPLCGEQSSESIKYVNAGIRFSIGTWIKE